MSGEPSAPPWPTPARAGEGPTLLEAKTYRLVPHTSDDDDRRYRAREEVAEWKAKDPIPRFEKKLIQLKILTAKKCEAIRQAIAAEIDAGVEFAESSAYPDPGDITTDVYTPEAAEMLNVLRHQIEIAQGRAPAEAAE